MDVKKIILTADAVLKAPSKQAGQEGVLIVVQDEIGGHLITLDEGNVGSSSIGYKPGAITQLEWLRDDMFVYWKSIILTADENILPPSKITDLIVELADTTNAKITWSAPQGFEGNDFVSTDTYFIVISTSDINLDLPLNGIQIDITPEIPGVKQEYIVSNLNSGQKYYIGIYSKKIAYGGVKTSLISNIYSFLTQSLDVDITVPKRIPLNEHKIYDTFVHTVFDPGEYLTDFREFSRLGKQDYIIDNNGIPEGTPPADCIAEYQSYGWYNLDWYNIPYYKVWFDLEGEYDLDYAYINVEPFMAARIRLFASPDGVTLFEMFDRGNTPIDFGSG